MYCEHCQCTLVSWRICLKYLSHFKVAIGSPKDLERFGSHLSGKERGVSAYPSTGTSSFATRQQAPGSGSWTPATANTLCTHTERYGARGARCLQKAPLSIPLPPGRRVTKPLHIHAGRSHYFQNSEDGEFIILIAVRSDISQPFTQDPLLHL